MTTETEINEEIKMEMFKKYIEFGNVKKLFFEALNKARQQGIEIGAKAERERIIELENKMRCLICGSDIRREINKIHLHFCIECRMKMFDEFKKGEGK